MIRAFLSWFSRTLSSTRLDGWMGVPQGWGLIVMALGFVVLMQVVNLVISLHKAGWLQWFAQFLTR